MRTVDEKIATSWTKLTSVDVSIAGELTESRAENTLATSQMLLRRS